MPSISEVSKRYVATNNRESSARKYCVKCLTILQKGKKHNCNSTTHIENLKDHIVTELAPKENEHLLSLLLKHKVQENSSERGDKKSEKMLRFSQLRGKPIQVVVQPDKTKENLDRKSTISADDVDKLRSEFNLSLNVTRGIASSLRSMTKDRKFFEPDLANKLITKNHLLDKYFSTRICDFIHIKSNKKTAAPEKVVYCNDINGLISFIKSKRSEDDVHLKVGVDGGGGFLKICLSVQKRISTLESDDSDAESDTAQSKDKFKDSGVKKIFVLAIAPGVQENYENISILWSLLKINELDCSVAADLKLANILMGIMNHSCKFPCTWCYAEKGKLEKCGEDRTIGNSLSNYQNWLNTGAIKKDAKKFKNCVNPPLFNGPQDKKILTIITPPQLH